MVGFFLFFPDHFIFLLLFAYEQLYNIFTKFRILRKGFAMFGFLKKKTPSNNSTTKQPSVDITWEVKVHPDFADIPCDVPEGDENDLPLGWLYENKVIVDKVSKEYSYFFDTYMNAKHGGDPVVIYGALKSLVIYIEEAREVCMKKGKNHLLWFDEYLTSKGQIEKYKSELLDIEENIEEKEKEYEEKLKRKLFEASLTDEFIIENIEVCEPATHGKGVLQKDFCKMFPYPSAVSSKLYYMEKEGKIERIKSGNSYILKVK